jgi:hypothetical protein
MCLAFRRIYGGQGMAADGVRRKRLGLSTKVIIKIGLAMYNHFYRKDIEGGRIGKPWAGPARPSLQPSAPLSALGSAQSSNESSVETPVSPN